MQSSMDLKSQTGFCTYIKCFMFGILAVGAFPA